MKKTKLILLLIWITLTAFGQDTNKILSTGDVGIGTTSPTEKLEVKNGRILIDDDISSAHQLIFGNANHGIQREGNVVSLFTAGTNGGISLIHRNWDGSGYNNWVTNFHINSAGNIGIGTTTPNQELQVWGNVGIGQISGSSGKAGLTLEYIDGGSGETRFKGYRWGQNFQWGHQASGVSWLAQMELDNSNRLKLYNSSTSQGDNTLLLNPNGDSFFNGGNVGIGTTTPIAKLSVNGQIRATEVKVLAQINVPDYVFAEDYELRTLKETKEYIAENKHLPEIPSASEIGENGIDLGDMNMRLLKKIEELTLYVIEQNERLQQLESKNTEIEELRKEIELLKNK
ncbi:MAG: hypothetical protein JXR03_00590 [Cyclobacteriaceae bacterium]